MNDESSHSDFHSRDYPVREDMAYQVKVWRFERWGWYTLVLLILLALLGLFSRGPLSTRARHQCRPRLEAVAADRRSGSGQPLPDVAR